MTIADIAREAGVSQATVSRVLNGHDSVVPEKREAVLRIVRETGFRQRAMVPKSAEPRNIGMVMLEFPMANPGIVLNKYENVLSSLGNEFSLVMLPSGIGGAALREAIRSRELCGLIMHGHRCPDAEFEEVLGEIPHLWLNSRQGDNRDSLIFPNNEYAGRLAAGYLLKQKKCAVPALLTFPSRNPGMESRFSGFRFAAFEAGVPCRQLALAECGDFETLDDRTLEGCIDRAMTPEALAGVDGLFIADDRLTALACRIFGRRNVPPDERPALVSCDNDPQLLMGLYPRPATIDLGPGMASLAIRTFLSRIDGGAEVDRNIAIFARPELIPGE
ncbi:LacI family DNA-binding transcriptional regulator [Victivallis vadensis]|uniref:LacI family DNA-binding transcriptional regulator n=1 Tax=Victivallis vadensis TaxID=172901 RepID=UPI000D79CCBD|nr:LacI family DNA-binding transcriptional regulator [Victivallis vadensis]PWM75343.1 MAG: hypothetical protein DBX90_12870 [Lentisphaerota bacterium]